MIESSDSPSVPCLPLSTKETIDRARDKQNCTNEADYNGKNISKIPQIEAYIETAEMYLRELPQVAKFPNGVPGDTEAKYDVGNIIINCRLCLFWSMKRCLAMYPRNWFASLIVATRSVYLGHLSKSIRVLDELNSLHVKIYGSNLNKNTTEQKYMVAAAIDIFVQNGRNEEARLFRTVLEKLE